MLRIFAGHVFVALCVLSARPTYAEIIDPFTEPAGGQTISDSTIDGNPVVSPLGGLNVYGGSREIFVNKTGQDGPGTQTVTASANEVVSGIFNFDQFSSTAQGTATLVYDGIANGQLDPMGFATALDLTGAGSLDTFVLRDMLVAGSDLFLTVNLYNDLDGSLFSSGALALMDGFEGDFLIPFISFTGDASTPMNVGAIEIFIDGSTSPGSDVRFGMIETAAVPEPSWMAFGAVSSLIGFCCRYRKRRNAATAA